MRALIHEDMEAAHRDVRHSFARLKELLLEHSVERPPRSVHIFDKDDLEPIMTYVANGYLRHFRLYRYNLSPRVQLKLKQHNPGFVDLPKYPKPLSQAIQLRPGEVSDLELSEEEKKIVEEEVARRMQPIRAEFEAEATELRGAIQSLLNEGN